jgi:hypothetical protein
MVVIKAALLDSLWHNSGGMSSMSDHMKEGHRCESKWQ